MKSTSTWWKILLSGLLLAGTLVAYADAYQPSYSTAGFYQLSNTGRTAYSMNPAWRFYKGHIEGAEQPEFNDKDWNIVSLPDGIADCDGLLKINREALLAVNRTPQMMIATIHGDLPVKKGQKLAGTRIIPLVIEQEKMDAMQAAAGSEPILNVLPMQAKKFAVITTGSEVFKGRIEDKFTPILVGKLAEYGCEMTFHKVCDDDPAGITAAILEAKEAGCELIFTTGGMSVDPDDRTPLAIRNTGADIVTYGAPVLPGAMFLVSYLDGVPVCGLPGCVMYAKRTIFDLLLPRLLADDAITAEDIARLGEGGLCLGCTECHWPNCGFGHC